MKGQNMRSNTSEEINEYFESTTPQQGVMTEEDKIRTVFNWHKDVHPETENLTDINAISELLYDQILVHGYNCDPNASDSKKRLEIVGYYECMVEYAELEEFENPSELEALY